MAVRETQLTPEQRTQEQATQIQGEKEFASKLAQSMDLPSTLTGEIDNHTKKAVEEPKEEVEEQEVEEAEEEQDEQAEEEPQAEEESQEESEDEDLIPKSKVQKRFDELTAEIKRLKADQQKAREEKESSAKKDSQDEQLEKMSESELKTLKRQVRVEQIKASSDEGRLSQLLDLEEKIDRTIQTAPQRFQQNQISRFNEAVSESASSIENFDDIKAEIFNHAKAIYESAPELQGSVRGQERAWKFAVDHYMAIKKASEGKSDNTELKRQVNTLKKKISVDTTSKKVTQQPDTTQRLFRKAVNGGEQEKKNFLRKRVNTDAFLSDEELSRL